MYDLKERPAQARHSEEEAFLARYTTRNAIYRWHMEEFHKTLVDLVRLAAPRTVLDAGCGEGILTDILARRMPDLKITGVDNRPGAIHYAQTHFPDAGHFRVGSVLDLPFPDRSFDLVLCSEVLEHLPDPMAALQELIRVSAGHVLITVPREPAFRVLNAIGRQLGINADPGHVQFWTKQTFQRDFGRHFDASAFRWKHTYQLVLGSTGGGIQMS
jgi:ubiquinone/menaquinone biosynthesis C-methylase UbiE